MIPEPITDTPSMSQPPSSIVASAGENSLSLDGSASAEARRNTPAPDELSTRYITSRHQEGTRMNSHSSGTRRTSLAYRISRRFLGLAILLLAFAIPAHAQVANPSIVQFDSADHSALIPAGQVGAGTPKITSYQALLLLASSDAVAGPVVAAGAVLPKASVVASPIATPPNPAYQATMSQLGITLPACTTLPCTQYSIVLTALGPGGTSLRGVASESAPFTATVPAATSLPAAPTNVVVKP